LYIYALKWGVDPQAYQTETSCDIYSCEGYGPVCSVY
jgi:hypothetical protein